MSAAEIQAQLNAKEQEYEVVRLRVAELDAMLRDSETKQHTLAVAASGTALINAGQAQVIGALAADRVFHENLATVQATNNRLQTKLAGTEKELAETKKELAEAQDTIKTLRQELDQANIRISTLETNYANVTSELNANKAQVGMLTAFLTNQRSRTVLGQVAYSLLDSTARFVFGVDGCERGDFSSLREIYDARQTEAHKFSWDQMNFPAVDSPEFTALEQALSATRNLRLLDAHPRCTVPTCFNDTCRCDFQSTTICSA